MCWALCQVKVVSKKEFLILRAYGLVGERGINTGNHTNNTATIVVSAGNRKNTELCSKIGKTLSLFQVLAHKKHNEWWQ